MEKPCLLQIKEAAFKRKLRHGEQLIARMKLQSTVHKLERGKR